MKKQGSRPKAPHKGDKNRTLFQFANSVGDFIRYWGFRRIHGQIWACLYLAKEPLSATALTRALEVSKALVSSAIGELESYGLIELVGGNEKTKLYAAKPDVQQVIVSVLKSREAVLIQRAAEHCTKLAEQSKDAHPISLDFDRIKLVQEMIAKASLGLSFLLSSADVLDE